MELKDKKCVGCGTLIVEQMMVPPVNNGLAFGLAPGEMGDTSRRQRMYCKVRCPCGYEYLAWLKPGPHGGTVSLGTIFRPQNDADFASPSAPPDEPDKPDEPVKEFEDKFAGIDMEAAAKAAKKKPYIPGTVPKK